jgi:uncharacterized protein YpmB
MKKFIWIPVVILLFIFGLLIHTYMKATEPLKLAEQKAIKTAFAETKMVEVEDFQIYHGLERVSILQGKNKKGESIIVWIPEDPKDLVVRKKSNGVSAKVAINKVKQLSQPTNIIDVRLGMEMGIPLWEIYYRSDSNLINYYHVDFETGEWLKKIENL